MDIIQFSDIPEISLTKWQGKQLPKNIQHETIRSLQKEVTEIRSAYRKAEQTHHYGYDVIRELYVCQEIIFVVKDKKRKQAATDRLAEIKKVIKDSGKDADKILDNFWRQSCFLMLDIFQVRMSDDKTHS